MTYGPALLAAASRVAGLSLSIYTDTTSATAYLRGRPIATVQRKRATDRSNAPVWSVYDLGGVCLGGWPILRSAVAMVERYAAALVKGDLPPACVVELAPDYTPRPLRLGVVRHTGNTRRGYTLAGVEPGHVFMRLRYLGQPAPTFRRKGDLLEWLALVGMAEGDAVATVGGAA